MGNFFNKAETNNENVQKKPKTPMTGKKKVFITTAVILGLIALRFLFSYGTNIIAEIMIKEAMIPSVVVDTIKEGEVSKTIETPGRIMAIKSVDLVARIDGYLQKKHYKDGDFVKKGQVLFTIEPQQYAIEVQKAQASVQSAKAQLKKAELDFKRAAELVKKDYISKATYDDRLAQKDIAIANLKSAQAQLRDAQRNLSYTKVTAPTDGKIGNIQITEGNYVSISSGALAKIVSMNPIYVLYSLDSKDFNELRHDTILPTVKQEKPIRVQLILSNGTVYPYEGSEDFYGNEVSETTGTIELRATFKNPDNILIPGDFVTLKIFSNTVKKQVLVPQSAVRQDNEGKYVFMLDENNKAKKIPIEIDGQYENNWIVTKGLNVGDKIVIKGALKLSDGKQAKVISLVDYVELQKENDASVSQED